MRLIALALSARMCVRLTGAMPSHRASGERVLLSRCQRRLHNRDQLYKLAAASYPAFSSRRRHMLAGKPFAHSFGARLSSAAPRRR